MKSEIDTTRCSFAHLMIAWNALRHGCHNSDLIVPASSASTVTVVKADNI